MKQLCLQTKNKLKNIFWCKWDKGIYLTDGTTMVYVYNGKNYALDKYRHAFENFLKDESKDWKTLYTDTISGKREMN